MSCTYTTQGSMYCTFKPEFQHMQWEPQSVLQSQKLWQNAELQRYRPQQWEKDSQIPTWGQCPDWTRGVNKQ